MSDGNGKLTRIIALGGSIIGISCVGLSKLGKSVELGIDLFFLGVVISFGILVEIGRKRLNSSPSQVSAPSSTERDES